ncbi:MAG TPA: hypothetical protein VK149_12590 [Sideroxyarcus sp.]|nr:hypothetical protein [Sideroxyarcus sp.]
MALDEQDSDAVKAALKEGLREWLDEKYAAFGKWSLHGLLASGLGALAYYLVAHGK